MSRLRWIYCGRLHRVTAHEKSLIKCHTNTTRIWRRGNVIIYRLRKRNISRRDERRRGNNRWGKSRFSGMMIPEAREHGVNRGGRYRVTNSAAPETYPFIVGHRVCGRTRKINRGLSLSFSVLYYTISVTVTLELTPPRHLKKDSAQHSHGRVD